MGREFRRSLTDGAALAMAALVAIREQRAELSGNPDKPADSVAYLLNQLKHPKEVALLRQIYGPSFVLLAGHATKRMRTATLIQRIAASEERAVESGDTARADQIIQIDEEEPGATGPDDLGQNTRNTYPLADMFVNLDGPSGELKVTRFLDLLFGHPFGTPSPDEVAMYHASAGALRSSDESRQVGAVIVDVSRNKEKETSNVDLIATGMNEVPKRGGGFYWDGDTYSPDARDQWLIAYRNDDRALTVKKDVLRELLEVLKTKGWFKESVKSTQTPELLKELLRDSLRGTQFMNIGEFQRQVHAEMAALIDAARRGVAVDGRTMYVTTFPCHNCAKHIIAAGLRQVVYLEPYPKSRAVMLHDEEIDLESPSGVPNKDDPRVIFSSYTGVAPRQYQRLFSMLVRGKKGGGLLLKEWDNSRPSLAPQHLMRNAPASYLMAERQELSNLPTDKYKWEPPAVCPRES